MKNYGSLTIYDTTQMRQPGVAPALLQSITLHSEEMILGPLPVGALIRFTAPKRKRQKRRRKNRDKAWRRGNCCPDPAPPTVHDHPLDGFSGSGLDADLGNGENG